MVTQFFPKLRETVEAFTNIITLINDYDFQRKFKYEIEELWKKARKNRYLIRDTEEQTGVFYGEEVDGQFKSFPDVSGFWSSVCDVPETPS
jgi:hypothetical protein